LIVAAVEDALDVPGFGVSVVLLSCAALFDDLQSARHGLLKHRRDGRPQEAEQTGGESD
jgi:hypothetical protein